MPASTKSPGRERKTAHTQNRFRISASTHGKNQLVRVALLCAHANVSANCYANESLTRQLESVLSASLYESAYTHTLAS